MAKHRDQEDAPNPATGEVEQSAAQRGQRLATLVMELERLEQEKGEAMADYKDRIRKVEEEIRHLSESIVSGQGDLFDAAR